MEIKRLEIRDRGTCVPALAIRLSSADGPIVARAGFGPIEMVYLLMLASEQAHYDAYHWPNRRTMGTAHQALADHWEMWSDGGVLDVRVVLGEAETPTAPLCAR